MRRRKALTQDEILDRRAQAAWKYRQRYASFLLSARKVSSWLSRNKEAINTKARLRMRQQVNLFCHATPFCLRIFADGGKN